MSKGKATVVINSGPCGLITRVTVETSSEEARLIVETDCKRVSEYARAVSKVKKRDIVKPILSNPFFVTASGLLHPSCPVPCGFVRACEAAFGMAVRKSASITFVDR